MVGVHCLVSAPGLATPLLAPTPERLQVSLPPSQWHRTSFSTALSEGLSRTKLEGLIFSFIKTPNERKRNGIECTSKLKKNK